MLAYFSCWNNSTSIIPLLFNDIRVKIRSRCKLLLLKNNLIIFKNMIHTYVLCAWIVINKRVWPVNIEYAYHLIICYYRRFFLVVEIGMFICYYRRVFLGSWNRYVTFLRNPSNCMFLLRVFFYTHKISASKWIRFFCSIISGFIRFGVGSLVAIKLFFWEIYTWASC